VATESEPLQQSEFFYAIDAIKSITGIIFVPQCLVNVLVRLRTQLVRAFFGWGSTKPYAEIQRPFSAKLLKQNSRIFFS
jgi:hypothetical protein